MICPMPRPPTAFDELRRSEQRLRAAFAQQFQFVAILDPEGRVLDFNQQLSAGGPPVAPEQVVGVLFWQTLWWRDHADMQDVWPARLHAAAATSGPVLAEDTFTSSSGEQRFASAAVTAVRDAAGALDCFIVQGTDTTERRRSEALKRALEAQLRETQKLEAIGTLAGGIAHDFNNILGAILGNLALASEAVGPGHAAQAPLGQIRIAGRRARELVHQILAFSRRQPQELVAQPLRPVIDETLALLRSTLPTAVQLDAVLDAEPLWVQADATQVQQVLVNLCTNAWHALNSGRGRIEVGVAAAPGQQVRLWVADDGIGMPAATRERIFEPFFTTKAVDEGTGLGLSVVHGIVTAHGGAISVDSTPGKGSRFTILLPRTPAGPPLPEPAAELPVSARSGVGHRVLYIDDDETMALVGGGLLQRAGHSVEVFQDAALALAALRERPGAFDLVVTDYNMPRLSGVEVALEVARIRPTLPVVITSGYVSQALHAEAAAAGVRHVLHKENTLEELCATVRRVLDADG
jgi:PAS domain S-box-containing protein